MPLNTYKLPITAGSAAEARLCRFLKDRVTSVRNGLKEIQETRYINWRRAYEAKPTEEVREFPFHNASNLIIPVIAIHSDTLLARLMAAIFKTQPLWVARMIGQALTQLEEAKAEFEKFLQYVGIEPTELDLYRVYHEWAGEAIRYGTCVLKVPWVENVEDVVVPGDGTGKYEFSRKVIYSGPRPEKIPFHDFGIPPQFKTIDSSDFKYHRVRLQRQTLEERAFMNVYDKSAVMHILKSPDLTSPDFVQSQAESDSGATTIPGYGWAEWHIYECHFRYRLDGGKFVRCIVWFHEKTNTILRAYFNYYPDEIFIAGRLFYRDDQFHGYGFAEMLSMIQEEISQIHNQRRDNMTIANTKVWRADPLSKLHEGYKIYPGAIIPAEDGEIAPLEHGEVSPMSIDEERLALDLAERRSGVQPPMQGMGAGTNSKRGVYSAMGTLSLLQEGNTRTDLNITDLRYAHTRVGRVVGNQYAEFGIGEERSRLFNPLLSEAVAQAKAKRLVIPVYSSTASVNREVEKQNDLMLVNVVMRHYQAIGQMLQSVSNPMLPEQIKEYLTGAITAANIMMRSVMRHFGYEDPERLVPDVKAPVTPGGSGQGGPPGIPAQGGPPSPQATPPQGGGLPSGPESNPLAALQSVLGGGGGRPQ